MFHVNVYELDQQYGGPEEGGWWYTTGRPVHGLCAVAPTREKAKQVADKVREGFVQPYYSLSSVLYSGGQMTVLIEEQPAKAFPEHRPYYE